MTTAPLIVLFAALTLEPPPLLENDSLSIVGDCANTRGAKIALAVTNVSNAMLIKALFFIKILSNLL
jgi:hypothetical protein